MSCCRRDTWHSTQQTVVGDNIWHHPCCRKHIFRGQLVASCQLKTLETKPTGLVHFNSLVYGSGDDGDDNGIQYEHEE